MGKLMRRESNKYAKLYENCVGNNTTIKASNGLVRCVIYVCVVLLFSLSMSIYSSLCYRDRIQCKVNENDEKIYDIRRQPANCVSQIITITGNESKTLLPRNLLKGVQSSILYIYYRTVYKHYLFYNYYYPLKQVQNVLRIYARLYIKMHFSYGWSKKEVRNHFKRDSKTICLFQNHPT